MVLLLGSEQSLYDNKSTAADIYCVMCVSVCLRSKQAESAFDLACCNKNSLLLLGVHATVMVI